MSEKIIGKGAEAILIKKNNNLIKKRIKKNYRLNFLDNKLRKSRTKKEANVLQKLENIIPVPKIKKLDNKNFEISMEFISGLKLSDFLDNLKNKNKIAEQIGKTTALLHEKDIIHSDLTTSNMIYKKQENKIFFIDFGLSFHSKRIEDKAVDIHLLKQALEAKHFKYFKQIYESVLKGYKKYKDYGKVLHQLKKVESRGKYKH